jgi:hypothetical protein
LLKKTITYENPFTNEQVSEEYYFHISKADLVQMEVEENQQSYVKDGNTLTGMQAKLQRIIDTNDGKAIMAELKDMIRRAYGKKDGDRFLKSEAIWEDFSSTEAFSQLLWELCTDAAAAAGFMNGIIPSNLEQIAADVREQAAKTNPELAEKLATLDAASARIEQVEAATADPTGLTNPVTPPITPRVLTRAEAIEMDGTELQSGLADGRYKLS